MGVDINIFLYINQNFTAFWHEHMCSLQSIWCEEQMVLMLIPISLFVSVVLSP